MSDELSKTVVKEGGIGGLRDMCRIKEEKGKREKNKLVIN